MLDGIAAGHFVPTDDPNDCSFCDFAEICRVRRVGFGDTVSPLAEWAQEHIDDGPWPAFEQLKRVRSYEE
jgi:hypothetical protein